MPLAQMPANEEDRLAVLRELNVLDTPPEAISESIALAAAAIANTPMAAISLIDADRQWLKAACGLGGRETERSVSFCTHAILESKPLLVPNALADWRFRHNPMVLGAPSIRFYAGFQLVVRSQTLGALCVIDDRVRELTPNQIKRLATLADATSAWLELRCGV